MKRIVLLLLLVVMLIMFTACTTIEIDETSIATDVTQQSQIPPATITEPPITTTPPTQESSFESFGMPEPFEHIGGDEDIAFSDRYLFKMYPTMISDEFISYLGISGEEYAANTNKKWGEVNWFNYVTKGGLTESRNLFSIIMLFDIPDEVVIDAIKKRNEHYESWEIYNIERYTFSDEDIAALLTRDEEIITAQFAEETAIIIGDRAFSPAWVYLHTPADYARAGITPAMIQEKLPMWQEFGFTDEAREAFEEKLTEFMGVEVSLARE